jgi:hypothetical protein
MLGILGTHVLIKNTKCKSNFDQSSCEMTLSTAKLGKVSWEKKHTEKLFVIIEFVKCLWAQLVRKT